MKILIFLFMSYLTYVLNLRKYYLQVVKMLYYYDYHSCGHYTQSCLVVKTQRFGDGILSPS